MAYICMKCRKSVEINYEYQGVRCPYCGNRILMKERPVIIKKIKAE